MAVELLLPGRRISAPKPPERIALDMAFGVGAGAVLGDKSRYRSHGAITTATWAAGVHGFCLDFNAATPDYVVIPAAHTQLNFIAEDFSIVVRFRVEDVVPVRIIFHRGFWNADGYYLSIGPGGMIDFYTFQTPGVQRSRGTVGSVAINTWYTGGISRAGNSVRCFLNGVDDTAGVGVHVDPLTCARPAVIGVRQDLATDAFDGQIEFLRVFRGIALPASSHLAWHNALA